MGKRELVALFCLSFVCLAWKRQIPSDNVNSVIGIPIAFPRDAMGLSAVCDCGIS